MRESHVMVADVLSAELDVLHRRHGPWRLTKALVATLLKRSISPEVNRTEDLDNHIRRDIGLRETTPEVDRMLQARFEQWRHYL